MPNSVMIVDDSYIVRRMVRDFFDALTDWNVAGEAGNGAEAIQKAMELKPDLIVLDFSMPGMNGVETACVIKNNLPDVHIVMFTMFSDVLGSTLASAAGIDLIVPKEAGLTDLVKAVQHFMGRPGAMGQP